MSKARARGTDRTIPSGGTDHIVSTIRSVRSLSSVRPLARKAARLLFLLAHSAGIATAATAATAGELNLAWSPSRDVRTAGYRVYVGDEPGTYTRVMDAGSSPAIALHNLADEQTLFIAVRAYDVRGRETGAVSDEISSLPRPRIDAVDPPSVRAGATVLLAISGANFDPAALVRSRASRVIVHQATLDGPGRILLEVEAVANSSEEIVLGPGSFTVINPGRKADAYFQKHPEVLDANGDGHIDGQDVLALREAFGALRGTAGYKASSDPDGDGIVDGHDLARILAATAGSEPHSTIH